YEQRIERYRVDQSEQGDVHVSLRTVAQLAAVKVTAAAGVSQRALSDGFEERVRQGLGHFLTPKDFDSAPAGSISANVPHVGIRLVSHGSITVMSGGHSSSGYCPVTIYIDGSVWWQPGPNSPPPNV